MKIGSRIKELRVAKHLSQGDIEHRTGLLRCYVSRVENGYTTPTLETLEKFAGVLKTPLYRLFTDASVKPPKLAAAKSARASWGTSGKDGRELRALVKALSTMDDPHQKLLLSVALKMARRNER